MSLLLVFAIVAGAFLPTQAGINAQLAKHLGHPLLGASIAFVAGALALLLYASRFMAYAQPGSESPLVPTA